MLTEELVGEDDDSERLGCKSMEDVFGLIEIGGSWVGMRLG